MAAVPNLLAKGLPLGLEPIYSTPEVNQPVVLYNGAAVLTQGSVSLSGAAKVQLEWQPRSSLRFHFEVDSSNTVGVELGEASLRLSTISHDASVYVRKIQHGWSGIPGASQKTSGSVKPVEIGSGSSLSSVVFHVVNFRNYLGRGVGNGAGMMWAGRGVTETDGWRVTLDKVNHETIFEEVEAVSGSAITHVGKLERTDGSTFSKDDADRLLEGLFRYLSFCRGSWAAPVLVVGQDANDIRVFEQWRDWKIQPWWRTATWFNDFSVEGFEAGLPGFWKLWNNETWNEPLLLALHWYCEANMSAGGVEGSVILAQAAFELLAWTLLVEDRTVLSEDGFQKLPAMDKLRLLISHCGIPLEIPLSLATLSSVAKAENWVDAPQALTEYRNALVHANPKKRQRVLSVDVAARHDAWDLSLWYLELVLLRLFEYEGQYSNRIRRVGFRGDEVEPVPWKRT